MACRVKFKPLWPAAILVIAIAAPTAAIDEDRSVVQEMASRESNYASKAICLLSARRLRGSIRRH